jgi:glycosyl transferase family 87
LADTEHFAYHRGSSEVNSNLHEEITLVCARIRLPIMIEQGRCWWQERQALEKWVILLWACTIFGIIVRLLILSPTSRTLFPVFRQAGIQWTAGVNLYPEQQTNSNVALYRYSPTVAVLFVAYSPLPQKAGDVCWRLLNALMLVCGLLWFIRSVVPVFLSRAQAACYFALMLPPALGHLSNGQCNALVIGLILTAFGAAADRRWNISACCMAVSVLFKLYPIAAGLLLVLLHPWRFGPRFAIALAVGLAIPFALQSPDYVLRQYQLWFHYATQEDRSIWALDATNVDLQLLFRVWLEPINLPTYRLIEIVVGLLFAAICWTAARTARPQRRLLTLALGAACVWMTVLGPATESPTYFLLAPCVTWGVLSCSVQPTRPAVRALMVVSFLLFLSMQLLGWTDLYYAARMCGLQPFGGLLYLTALLIEEWTWAPPPAELPARGAARMSGSWLDRSIGARPSNC